tara:strand:+ start:1831 stop:2946 length:1116 start_codon:yes stop_codon:yes gene_type:complete
MSKTYQAVATLVGTIIGAGILGIPFVIMKSGFTFGLINIVLIGIVMLITMLYLGEIALRTKENLHLSGYAEKYLGKKGKLLMFIAVAFGVYSAVLAYLIGEGQSLSQLIFNNLDNTLYLGLAFWVVMSALTWYGLKALKEGEELGVSVILILIVAIVIFAWNKIDVSNLSYNNPTMFFVPFGVVLFAFLGFTAIPEVEMILGKEKKLMKRSILIALIGVTVIYAIFAAVVLGYLGPNTPELATLTLGKAFILLGMFTMFTSYLALSIALTDTFKLDFKISRFKSWFLTISIPLVLFLILTFTNSASFTKVLGVGGVLSGGLTAILILFMVKKAKRMGDDKPAYSIPYSHILTGILIAIFVLGATLEIWNIF